METRVILDANAYIETNYGRSGKFTSLVDFLKKSGSRLVLLSSVLEEVLATYERDFRERVEAAKKSAESAAKYSFTSKRPSLVNGEPDFAKEKDTLKKHLRNPDKAVGVEYVEGCPGVDPLEVVRRGALRVPPASANGEELRDVIHWLTVISHAKQVGGKILFVSRDKGFWTKDEGPREHIVLDIETSGGHISLFKDIEALLKENSLSSKPLDAKRAIALFDLTQVAPPIVERVGRSLDGYQTGDSVVEFRSGELVSSRFDTGTTYQVSTESEFAEATFEVAVNVQFEFVPKKVAPWLEAALASLAGRTVPLSALGRIRRPPPEPRPPRTTSLEMKAFVDMSMRVNGGKPGVVEVDRVRLT